MDTRIFSRECRSLTKKYEVSLIAPAPFISHSEIRHIKLPALKILFWRILFVHPVLFWKIIQQKKAAVYHFHDPELLPLAFLLSVINFKVILDIHEWVEKDIGNKKLMFKKQLSLIYRWFENLSSKRITFILAENSYEKNYVSRLLKYFIILNYPDYESLRKFQSTNRHSRKLFYIGNLTGNRGLKQMIQVLNYLKSKNEIFELICFGEINRRLSRLLSEIPGYENIKNQVVFKGFIPVEEAMKFSADCLAGIAIYDDLPNHRNSMPTKIFEYMSVGLPVITSNFPDYIEIILKNKCGFCLQPDDIENIATTIIDLYNNPDLAHNMAINGINSVKECYNWTSEELKLVDIYQNLLA